MTSSNDDMFSEMTCCLYFLDCSFFVNSIVAIAFSLVTVYSLSTVYFLLTNIFLYLFFTVFFPQSVYSLFAGYFGNFCSFIIGLSISLHVDNSVRLICFSLRTAP